MDGSILVVLLLIIGYWWSGRNLTEFSKYDKKQYMKSSKWKAKRKLVIKRDKVCQKCAGPGTEVHHISYRYLGNEPLKDLALLCRKCHQKIHDRKGYDYGTTYNL